MQSNSIPPHDYEQARRFLQLLGKPPEAARLRAFPHKKSNHRKAIGARKGPWDLEQATRWNREGRGIYVVINDGGDTKEEITACRALFVEWDDREIDLQVTAWQRLGLPEPTLINNTGRSAHTYWVLREHISPERFEQLLDRLIAYCQSDPACNGAARVMRVPGFHYIDATDKPSHLVEIIHESGRLYSADQIEACLPKEQPPTPEPAETVEQPLRDLLGREAEDLPEREEWVLLEALKKVPPFQHDQGRRDECLKLAFRLHMEVGKERAMQLLAQHSPALTDVAGYFNTVPTKISPGSIWGFLRDKYGVDISRWDLKRSTRRSGPGNNASQAPTNKAPLLSLEEVRQVLDERIQGGIGGADLAVLVADLATRSDRHSSEIQRIAQQVEKDYQAAQGIEAERRALAEENDRKEISEHITAAMLLPAEIAEALDTCTASLPTDGPSKVLPFLATIAGLVKLGTQVKVLAGYTAPINLYACLVADSGAKKSPVGKLLVERPIAPLVLEIAQQNHREHEAWQESCQGLKRDERPPQPVPRRIRVSGATGEALATQLQAQEAAGLGLLIHRDELSGLFGALNAYRGGRGDDEQLLLEIYDGGGLTALRVGGDRHFSRSQVAIYGTTQPRILKTLVAGGDDSGLWARFLFCPLPAKVMPLPAQETQEAIERFDAAAGVLADACRFIYTLPRATYRLAQEAYQRFWQFEEQRQREALGTTISAQGALYNKSAGKVIRVAGLIHLLRIAAGEVSTADEITADCIDRAVTLVGILDEWALSLHAEIAAGGGASLMRSIHTIAWKTRKAMPWKEIRDKLSQTQRKGVTAAAGAHAIKALAADGYGVADQGARGGLVYRATIPMP